jgi:glycosyltransferase involved in cell wall biosynthesis
VHAYGAEPVLPLIAGARPYIAFEHGTIRALPFENSPLGRLTALAYREADAVLITNADNRTAAERLGIKTYRFVPHPVNEHSPNRDAAARLRADLNARLSADFIVFHPSRQHWDPSRNPHLEKGNDRLIDGLAVLFAERPRSAAVFVNWGATTEASRARVAARGITDRVLWIDPIPGPALARYMAAADVVADQFFLGAFGAITPRALFLGTPALLFFDAQAHRWCFDEPPPVLNAATPNEIAAVLTRAYDDRAALKALAVRGREWYGRYHSNAVVRRALLDAYRSVLRPCSTANEAHPTSRVAGV